MKPATIVERVSRYTILNKLGAGGMGEVFLAEDTLLHRKVAIKLLPHDSAVNPQGNRHLIQEAQAAARLDHPNICTVHEVGEEAGRCFIVMEYVEGETLAMLLRNRRLDLSECLEIAVQVADALAEAHSQGLTHRDITPQNIMLTTHHQVKVIDFGLAKFIPDRSLVDLEAVTESLLTDRGVIVGTVAYMSPEQVRGHRLDARSDIFSFGAVLYEMITGHRAFVAENTATVVSAIKNQEPSPLASYSSGVPPKLQRIVSKALCKDRKKRYQTTSELLTDLRSLKRSVEFELEFGPELPKETRANAAHRRGAQEAFDLCELTAITQTDEHSPSAEVGLTIGSKDIQGESHSLSSAILLNRRGGKVARQRWGAILLIACILAAVSGVIIHFVGRRSRSSPAATGLKNIAVLPFRSLSPDSDDEYLGLGISDTLITRLSNLRQIVIRPTGAVRKYAGREFDPYAAGRELRVDAVMEGAVERVGDRLRVNVRLISIPDARPVWGKTFDEKFTNILTVQDQIAERLTDALAIDLTVAERRVLAKQYTSSAKAYRLYLKGRYFWNKRTAGDLKKSVGYFKEAIENDPRFALAYAGLADSYSLLADYDALPLAETYSEAKMAVTKALDIDGELAEARTSLAYIKAFFEWDWASAETEFKKAIELNPNYATAHQWYAEYLSARGRTEEALAEIRKAEELDPVSLIISAVEAWILYLARDYDGAIAKCLKVIEMDPNFAEAYEYLKRSYDQKKMYREAIAARQTRRRILGRDSRETAALRIAGSSVSGRVYWQKRLEQEIEESKQERVSPFEMAEILAQQGQKDGALDWLEKAHAQRDFMIAYTKVTPNLDPLRSDARFADLLHRVGLD